MTHLTIDSISIGDRTIGSGQSPFLLAEVGLAHDGSLGAAHAYIDAAAECGVDGVKFQTHIAAEESTSAEEFRVKVFPQDATRFDYWKRTAFEKSQWQELAAHAKERQLLFLSSPFCNLAVDWLYECGVPAWKVASGELTNIPMIARMCNTGLPLLISSGLSSWGELSKTVEYVKARNVPFGIFQCTTAYPCPPEKWGLNVLAELKLRFDCPVGLSDHSGEVFASLAAVSLGASMIEFHIAFSKSQFGPDAKASLTPAQASELVRGVKQVHLALRNPIDKDRQARDLAHLHGLFTKSIVAATRLEAGQILKFEDLAFKKPGTGISASEIGRLIGRKLNRSVSDDHFFSEEDFE
ncbi:MAG: N-acetylneuraminate synthase family protein [Planctomycetota bacterium]|jgi:N,N'-diacetyllegionaminate synthase